MERPLARRMWFGLEPIHGMIYFVPEGPERYGAAGLDGARAGYFASRSAAMGAVSAATVRATFYNFHPELVHRAMDGVWERASPADVLTARLAAVDGALRRMLGDDVVGSPVMTEAADLARVAAEACDDAGRPLAAGHRALPWPDDAHLALWQALTVLREHRGDGHVAALVVAGIGPCEALVLHAASGEVPAEVLQATRAWPDDEWAAAVARLRADGLVDDVGALSAEGSALREGYEARTDELAALPWQVLGPAGCDRLYELARPWAKTIVSGGGLPIG